MWLCVFSCTLGFCFCLLVCLNFLELCIPLKKSCLIYLLLVWNADYLVLICHLMFCIAVLVVSFILYYMGHVRAGLPAFESNCHAFCDNKILVIHSFIHSFPPSNIYELVSNMFNILYSVAVRRLWSTLAGCRSPRRRSWHIFQYVVLLRWISGFWVSTQKNGQQCSTRRWISTN